MKWSLKILALQLFLIACLSLPVFLNTAVPFFIVSSNSMFPEIPTGTVIVIGNRKMDFDHIKGKAIVFYNPPQDKVYVHRVIDVQRDFYVTKGDNNLLLDTFLPSRKNVLGVVIFKVKWK